MAIGLKLRILDTRSNTTQEHVFAQFPVRIGRNPLNDLRLSPTFVSQFHAVLEVRGTTLMLRDLGSRNGTQLPAGRAPAHEPVELAGGQFAISALQFEARIEDIGDIPPPKPPQRGLLLGGLMAVREDIQETMVVGAEGPTDFSALAALHAQQGQQGTPRPAAGVASEPPPGAPRPAPAAAAQGTPSLRALQPQYASSRAVVSRILQTLSTEVTSLSPEDKQKVFTWTAEAFPGLSRDAEFQRLVEHHGVSVADDASRARRLEYVALQAVRELASLYCSRKTPIATEEELVAFLIKVRDTLDLFLKCFVPLRDGYRQFKSDMDIRQPNAPQFDTPAGRATKAVESARNPRAIAELLLDWEAQHNAAHRAVEGAFADLMIHQLALLSGVMRGVKSLVQELSPAAVEAGLEDWKKKGKAGWMWGPYRFRELWNVYVSRHGDLNDGEKQLYSLVFGLDFARAYSQLSGEAMMQSSEPKLPS